MTQRSVPTGPRQMRCLNLDKAVIALRAGGLLPVRTSSVGSAITSHAGRTASSLVRLIALT